MKFPEKARGRVNSRKQNNSFRVLGAQNDLTDFSSNDYLGFSKSRFIRQEADSLAKAAFAHGATGSRLLTGNHSLYSETERIISEFHQSESALIFNSGYDANVGFLSSLPQRNDIILYDELSHASIRDGIKMSNAKAYKFPHNDLSELEQLIIRHQSGAGDLYIVTESVFSMDGNSPDLIQLVDLSDKNHCYTIIDEAHALGVFGETGQGLVQQLNLQDRVFARILTFGKGLGCHGAAVLGSKELTDYLINFARSFIYSTGLPPHSIATIAAAYRQLIDGSDKIEALRENISFFNVEKNRFGLKPIFVRSRSAIQSAIIPGNSNVKRIAEKLQQQGFDIRPILSPTVPEGQERLRICIHSYNTHDQISEVMQVLATSF
ncbi:MAG TPA: pyridoxal phosphate-dependent aminotransferase family protein [Flavobacterium sp.]|jgi:8-amino-7-oxononanoate synthase